MKLSTLFATIAFAPALLGAQATLSIPATGSFVGTFGRPNTQTYGQTFRAPVANTTLQNFSLWISSDDSFEMKAYVYQWSGTQATGTALFASDLLFAPSGFDVKTTIDIGGLDLTEDDAYVFFLSTSGLQGVSGGRIEINFNNTYGPGSFVFTNNGDDTTQWTSTEWQKFNGPDLRFEANFTNSSSVVPEPSTNVLMATGLAGLAGIVRRRRHA